MYSYPTPNPMKKQINHPIQPNTNHCGDGDRRTADPRLRRRNDTGAEEVEDADQSHRKDVEATANTDQATPRLVGLTRTIRPTTDRNEYRVCSAERGESRIGAGLAMGKNIASAESENVDNAVLYIFMYNPFYHLMHLIAFTTSPLTEISA